VLLRGDTEEFEEQLELAVAEIRGRRESNGRGSSAGKRRGKGGEQEMGGAASAAQVEWSVGQMEERTTEMEEALLAVRGLVFKLQEELAARDAQVEERAAKEAAEVARVASEHLLWGNGGVDEGGEAVVPQQPRKAFRLFDSQDADEEQKEEDRAENGGEDLEESGGSGSSNANTNSTTDSSSRNNISANGNGEVPLVGGEVTVADIGVLTPRGALRSKDRLLTAREEQVDNVPCILRRGSC